MSNAQVLDRVLREEEKLSGWLRALCFRGPCRQLCKFPAPEKYCSMYSKKIHMFCSLRGCHNLGFGEVHDVFLEEPSVWGGLRGR